MVNDRTVEIPAYGSTGQSLSRWITAAVLKDAERVATERSENRAQLPSFAGPLAQVWDARKFVNSANVEVEAHVMISEAAAILKIRVGQRGATYGVVVVDLRVVPLSAAVR